MGIPKARRLISTSDYYRMAEADIFGPEERLELINGEIIYMSPIGSKHAAIVRKLTKLFYEVSGEIFDVSIQKSRQIK